MASSVDHGSASVRAGVFSRESKGKGTSIEDQDRENLAVCASLGAKVVVTLRDVVGASRFSTKERVGWPEIVDLVDSGQIDLLVVWEVSRADRTMDSWVPFVTALAASNVRLHITSLEMTYDPRKAAHRKALLDMGSSAEAETGQLSERTRKGTAGAALAGKGHGPVGYGFTRIYDAHDRKKFTQAPNDDAPVAVAIIERIARRVPLRQIVKELNEAGILSPGGGKWTSTGVREMAKNPAYAGLRDHKGTLYEANWKPLVPVATWRTAMAVLSEPGRKKAAPGARKWLLSGFATGKCGEAVYVRPASGQRQAAYLCNDGCVGIAVADLDEWVLRLIVARLMRDDAREVFKVDDAEAQRAQDAVARIQLELDDLEAQLRKGPDNGGISATLAAAAEPDIRKRLAAAQARVKTSGSHGAALTLLGSGKATEKSIRAHWDDMSVAGRHSAVTDLFKSVKVMPATLRLTRHASENERLAAARDRTVIEWA